MAQILSGSIDLTKIDKSKIVKVDKNGQPFKNNSMYLNVQVSINDEVDDYGNNASISINQSKEERERGDKKVYLGNLKVVWTNDAQPQDNKPSETKAPAHAGAAEEDDDLPF